MVDDDLEQRDAVEKPAAGEEHANAEVAEDGDAIELKGDKLEVEEPIERGLGAAASIFVLGATTTVTIPACAAAVFSISEPVVVRKSSAAVVGAAIADNEVDVSIGVTSVCSTDGVFVAVHDDDDDDEDEEEDVEDAGDSAL